MRFLFTLCASYLLLTVIGTRWIVIPDLLVVMIIFAAPASLWRSMGYGFITGALLDVTTGLGIYHTVIYTIAGIVIGAMPSTILQTNTAASMVNTALGTLVIYSGYALLTRIFEHQILALPWYMLLFHMLINCLIVWVMLAFISWNKGKPDEIR